METSELEYSRKIYKNDSTGKIRVLHVYTEGSTLIQESGILGSDKLVKHTSVCTSKNIGKTNETTPEQQARLEAASKIETKLTTGYFDTVEEATEEIVILPMLAKDFKKESHKVKYPCYGQPKLDGMRALGRKNNPLISRKGKEINTMSHIQEELDNMYVIDCFDGELYAHGLSFEENMTIIKKYRKGQTENVKYHVYDMVYPKLPFSSRYTILSELVVNLKHIELVTTKVINNLEELTEFHKENIALGYEGTIIRHSEAGYAINKRDTQLLKYKDFLDMDLEIIDITPNESNPKHGTPHFNLKGKAFKAGVKMSHEAREDLLTNKDKYIGKIANIRYFELTDDGIPRFPVMIGIHEDR